MTTVQGAVSPQSVAGPGDPGNNSDQFLASITAARNDGTTVPGNSAAQAGGTPSDQSAAAAPAKNPDVTAKLNGSVVFNPVTTNPFDIYGAPPAMHHPAASLVPTLKGSLSYNFTPKLAATVYGQGTTQVVPNYEPAENAVATAGVSATVKAGPTTTTLYGEVGRVEHGPFSKPNFNEINAGLMFGYTYQNKNKGLTVTSSLNMFNRSATVPGQEFAGAILTTEAKKSLTGASAVVPNLAAKAKFTGLIYGYTTANEGRVDHLASESVGVESTVGNFTVGAGIKRTDRFTNRVGRSFSDTDVVVEASFSLDKVLHRHK